MQRYRDWVRTSLATTVASLSLSNAVPIAQAGEIHPRAPGTPQPTIEGAAPASPYAVLRQDEDWSFDLPNRPLKWIALDSGGVVRLDLAGDAFLKGKWYRNQSFGDVTDVEDNANTRLNLHAGLTIAERVRLYIALKHGGIHGSKVPASPVADEPIDLHQSFAEVRLGDAFGLQPNDVLVRLGRQELHYGAGRLISIREGPNVRNDFDGALVRARLGGIVSDAFYFEPSLDGPDAFDNAFANGDGFGNGDSVWGLYGSGYLGSLGPATFEADAFYVGFGRADSPYVTATFSEVRHTIGVRLWSMNANGPKLEIEGGYQFGTASSLGSNPNEALDVSAYYLAGQVGWRFAEIALSPTVGVDYGISSGDHDPKDGTLGTFRAPYPPGRYFGETNPLGPGNLTGARLFVDIEPLDGMTLTAQVQAFWRLSPSDGVYSPPGTVLRGPAGSERFVGYEPGIVLNWAVDDHWNVFARAARFVSGPFLDDNKPGKDITNFELNLSYRF